MKPRLISVITPLPLTMSIVTGQVIVLGSLEQIDAGMEGPGAETAIAASTDNATRALAGWIDFSPPDPMTEPDQPDYALAFGVRSSTGTWTADRIPYPDGSGTEDWRVGTTPKFLLSIDPTIVYQPGEDLYWFGGRYGGKIFVVPVSIDGEFPDPDDDEWWRFGGETIGDDKPVLGIGPDPEDEEETWLVAVWNRDSSALTWARRPVGSGGSWSAENGETIEYGTETATGYPGSVFVVPDGDYQGRIILSAEPGHSYATCTRPGVFTMYFDPDPGSEVWSTPVELPDSEQLYPLQDCSTNDELQGTYRIGPSHNIVYLDDYLYLAVASARDTTSGNIDLFIYRSDNGGDDWGDEPWATWTGPSGEADSDQVMAWVAASTCDRLNVLHFHAYVADLEDPAHLSPRVARIKTSDGTGVSTTLASDFTTEEESEVGGFWTEEFMGDYHQITSGGSGNVLYPCFVRYNSTDGHRHIYTKRIVYVSCGVGGGSFVSMEDAAAFADYYEKGDMRADINYDGYVDGADAALFTSEYPKQVVDPCGD